MRSNTLPEHLKIALQRHVEDDDLRDDSDLPALMDKLTTLSEKVNAAKEKALALRKQRA
ncbi:hypothetical protein J3L16_10380 [Alteromonas sp. 5E99-2]|uniref:hypothetical protein n=1 Tax=Alteromonas sp. 5E99-2 TaxID=2817683 RepID=UPI001A98AD61|nr:hypothetical protein [Alteromonas sp. 5E99-2]MBO1256091.1 hypothetical protein [Alteromonas sp. 5E99-2]